jgi:hypothetical protein
MYAILDEELNIRSTFVQQQDPSFGAVEINDDDPRIPAFRNRIDALPVQSVAYVNGDVVVNIAASGSVRVFRAGIETA